MKKLLNILTGVFLLSVTALGQSPAPGIFNYQGVARNSVGNVLINKTISLRLTVHDATASGPNVYQESRTVTTNPFGLFNVQVGSAGASNVTGTIAGVNWGVNAKFIQVEIDPNGGSSFINIGTAQLASVPYSLYSSLSGDLVLPFNKTQADAGSLFKITNSNTASAGATALEGVTNSTAGNANAVIGTVSSTSPGGFSAGVRGVNSGTGGLGIGVYGSQAGSGWGVFGTAPSGIGVNGQSTSGVGVNGASTSGNGVAGASNSATGVAGVSTSGGGVTGTSTSASGVAGVSTSGGGVTGTSTSATGVAGVSTSGTGVSGASNTGTAGSFVNTNAANTAPTLFANNNNNNTNTFFNATAWAQKGTVGATNYYYIAPSAVKGIAPLNGAGVQGSSETGIGTAGLTYDGQGVVGASMNNGTGLMGIAYAAGGYALRTQGKLMLTAIGESNNYVLTSDAVGNATWKSVASVGGVTGSGTLNYVPKWTPSGTNLGNSQLFDDGTNVGIGTTSPFAKLDVLHGGGSGIRSKSSAIWSSIDVDGANGDGALRFFNNGSADWHIGNGVLGSTPGGLDFWDMKASVNRMMIENGSGNVGISTNTPGARLHVSGSRDQAATVGGLSFPHQAVIAQTASTTTSNISRGLISYAANSSVENQASFVLANAGGSAFNVGTFSLASGATTGMNYGYYTNVGGATGGNVGIQANAPSGANDYAAILNGKVRIADGTQGVGRIFTDAGTGNGNGAWKTAAAAGLVSGSGTTNFMTKWTPNGTTLGNSIVYDNGNSLNVNTTTPDNSTLLLTGGTYPALRIKNGTSLASNGGIYIGPNTNQDIYFGTNENAATTFYNNGSEKARISANGNLGVGDISPTARVSIGNVTAADNNTTMPWGFPNPLGLNINANAGGVNETTGLLAFAEGATTENNSIVAIPGTTGYYNIGLLARVSNVPTGTNNSYGLVAFDAVGNSQTWAAWFSGRVILQDGTQGVGKVLTSDATGNASWQDNVAQSIGISARTFTGPVIVNSGIGVPLTSWATILNEDGGANYNAGTGEYTITKTGVYQIDASVIWDGVSSVAGGAFSLLQVYVNGGFIYESANSIVANATSSNVVNYSIRLNAGDKVNFQVYQNSGSAMSLTGGYYGQNFSIHYLHK